MNKRREKRRPERRIGAKDILGILLGLFLLFGIPNLLLGLFDKMGEPGTYNMYAGPVMPLSSLSGGEGVEVSRNVTLDFGACQKPSDFLEVNRVGITDAYILTNPSREDITMELVFSFQNQLAGSVPVITTDGVPVDGEILFATDADGSLSGADDFEAYRQALEETDYLAEAMTEPQLWEVPVKVYHFYNIAYQGDLPYEPVLDIGYNYGETTSLWVRSYRGFGYDRERNHITYPMGEDVWLYVIGDDLEDLSVCGSKMHTMGVYQATEVEGVTWELETYESTFMDCLWEAAVAYEYEGEENIGSGAELVTPRMLCDFAIRCIVGSEDQQPGDLHRMNAFFDSAYEGKRIIYRVFSVVIPAEGSVKLSIAYDHQVNWNTFSEEEIWEGVDVATRLDSNLNMTEQTATLKNTAHIAVAGDGASQNFGFDPGAGITTVEMDPTVERYYIDVTFQK